MGQLGGMLTDQTMGAFGQFTPEEMKASSLDKILGSRKGPPQTDEENTALITELAQAGHAQEARQAMLNYQNDKQSRLQLSKLQTEQDILSNKGDVNAVWTGVAKPNYINEQTRALFEIYDIDSDGVPTMALFRKILKDKSGEKPAEIRSIIGELSKKIIGEEKNWKTRNQTKQFGETSKVKPITPIIPPPGSELKDPPSDDATSTTGTGIGYMNLENVPQVDEDRSQFIQSIQESKASGNVAGRLTSIFWKYHSFEPEFMMSDKDLDVENDRDDVQDWVYGGIQSEAYNWFKLKENAHKLPLFEKDPIGFYKKFIKGKAK
jgi:hypothetical protein